MTETSIRVSGMTCGHCVMRVKKAVEGLNGVSESNVSIGLAKIVFDENVTSRDVIARAISDAGYKAE